MHARRRWQMVRVVQQAVADVGVGGRVDSRNGLSYRIGRPNRQTEQHGYSPSHEHSLSSPFRASPFSLACALAASTHADADTR